MEKDVEIRLIVDNDEIEVNLFVQNVIGKAIVGAVSALKGVKEDWTEIEVRVRRRRAKEAEKNIR